MSKPLPKPPAPFDAGTGTYLVPGKTHTAETLVEAVNRIRVRRGMSAHGIVKACGMAVSVPAVLRFFQGYRSTTEADRVNDPERTGRVRLDTFLQIIHTLGYDVELVARQARGRLMSEPPQR